MVLVNKLLIVESHDVNKGKYIEVDVEKKVIKIILIKYIIFIYKIIYPHI